MRTTIVLSTLMAGLVASCRSTTAPPPFVGQYNLVVVDGSPLPTAIGTGIEIQRGWLRLAAGGEWMLSRTQHAYANPGAPSADTLSGRWTAAGDDVTLYFASTSVVQAVATYEPPAMVVLYASKRYRFVPE